MNPNDPAMMDIMSKVMQDPELMALMQKPEVMQKLQTIMSNPAAAMQYMADPDMMRLMTKLQGLTGGMGGGMGGFGGGMGGMGGFGGAGGGAAPAAGGHGGLKHIRDTAHFEREMRDAGSKLFVVDFFTTWCGPCKRIAPAYEQMAQRYEGKAVFVKVDGDQCRELCAQKGVQGFPTFHFYQNGKLVEQFSGADEGRLANVVKLYVSDADESSKPSPYKHFPLKESETVSYKDCKFDAVADSMRKFNADLGSSHSALALSEDDSKALDALAATLNAVNQYHSSQVTPAQFAAVDKLLQWPVEFCSPGLHFLRMLVRHPQATVALAKRLEERKDPLDLLKVVIKVAAEAPKPAHTDLALRTLTNFFGRRALQKIMGQRYEEVLDGVASLATHADVKVRTACLGLLINYAILFREDDKHFAQAKVQMLSTIAEVVSNETDKGAIYRALVILGTLIFRDNNTREMASDIGVASQVDAQAMKNPADVNITQCAAEVLQALQAK